MGNGLGKRRMCRTAIQYLTPVQYRAVLKQAQECSDHKRRRETKLLYKYSSQNHISEM
jgi:hypothetical protein